MEHCCKCTFCLPKSLLGVYLAAVNLVVLANEYHRATSKTNRNAIFVNGNVPSCIVFSRVQNYDFSPAFFNLFKIAGIMLDISSVTFSSVENSNSFRDAIRVFSFGFLIGAFLIFMLDIPICCTFLFAVVTIEPHDSFVFRSFSFFIGLSAKKKKILLNI